MKTVQKTSEKLYFEYEYLAKKYANKVFSYERLSYEFEDLVQEFRIKIFTSIKAYGRRYAKYLRGEASKPVHIKYYLECACANKVHDFTKYISRENKVSIDEIHFDYGAVDETTIIPEKNLFVINGINLLEGLTGKERAIFSLYLRGYKGKLLTKVYYSNKAEKRQRNEVVKNDDTPITPNDVIEMQKRYLIENYGNDLLRSVQVFQTYNFDED